MAVSGRKTPGVYVTEENAFPPSVVGVQTAVPAFVGYTEKAQINGKPVWNTAQKINSFADYEACFGGPPDLTAGIAATHDPAEADVSKNGAHFRITLPQEPIPMLHRQMKWFYENGGGSCFVVAVGKYDAARAGVTVEALKGGLYALAEEVGPTLLVIPEAVLLPSQEDFAKLVQAMLAQCGELQDRFAILDVWGADKLDPAARDLPDRVKALSTAFRASVGREHLDYAAAYFPPIRTSVIGNDTVDHRFFDAADLQTALTAQAKAQYSGNALAQVTALIARIPAEDSEDIRALEANLRAVFPILKDLEEFVAGVIGTLPPSGAMAGVYTRIDSERGVWNAPANTNLASAVAPIISITDDMQQDLNVPIDGKAIDAIREFVGRGTVVWGARTLDGNSNDWRYIPVRRTIIYIEQSIKTALDPFVFAPNTGDTWNTVTAMVSNFLHGIWTQGGLLGATASQAYSVECGLGSTMTPQDVLDGYMIVQVRLQLVHPAEFIVLTFQQKMAE